MRPRWSLRGGISRELRRGPPLLFLLLSVVLGACANSTVTGSPAEPSSAASSRQPTTAPRSARPSPAESEEPAGSAAASPLASPASGSAAGCSGNAENRDFFASMAAAVDWPVYCPVLADGWFVQSGQYRLAEGGRLEIVYQGPNRATITLDEGAFCTIPGGCVAPGEDVGSTDFGDRTGTLVALDDGSWAVAVDREVTPSWILVVTGLGEDAARTIAADLLIVEG